MARETSLGCRRRVFRCKSTSNRCRCRLSSVRPLIYSINGVRKGSHVFSSPGVSVARPSLVFMSGVEVGGGVPHPPLSSLPFLPPSLPVSVFLSSSLSFCLFISVFVPSLSLSFRPSVFFFSFPPSVTFLSFCLTRSLPLVLPYPPFF